MEGLLSGVVIYGPEARGTFIDNEVCYNRESGIFVFAGAQPRVAQNACFGNHHFGMAVRDPGSHPEFVRNHCLDNMLSGMLLFHHAEALLLNNVCRNNQHWGIVMTPECRPTPPREDLAGANELTPNPRGPIIVTEQYPKGLGRTAAEITAHLPEGTAPLEKLTFSACGVQEFDLQLREHHAEQVIVCGIEAHICVSQTAHDLLQLGYQVHVLSDAVATRLPHNREVALQKLTRNGAFISSVEMALFELCGGAGTPEFKQVQQLVKGLQ